MRHLLKLVPIIVISALFITLACLTIKTDASGAATNGALTPASTPMCAPSQQVFSATVKVIPSAMEVKMGKTLVVTVSVSTSEGCQFPIYELTLGQSSPVFEYVSPSTAMVRAPGNPFAYTLTAISTSTVTFDALLYGERYCGDFWQWTYLRGESEPVTVLSSSTVLITAVYYDTYLANEPDEAFRR